MGKKIQLDEEEVVKQYLNGKSSSIVATEFKVSKPKILSILKKHNVIRKKDRCKSLNYKLINEYYVVERICPTCKEIIQTKSKNKIIACRNHFVKIDKNCDCKNCSLKKQIGKGNPFYGKKHDEKTKNKISKSRKGKAKGFENGMSNPDNKKRAHDNLKQKWNNGEMEHVRKMFSETMKNTRRMGKIKSINRSKKEKEILKEIKNMGYQVKHSLKIDTKICDIYIPKLNLIIEYNGDYWHCNPKKYDASYYHQVKKKTAQELWEYDNNKIDLIKSNGYFFEVVWESELKSNPQIINNLIKKHESREQSNSRRSQKN
jgi:G:T-mismatch repair DNA endonuclease (very short patch repair protein)